MAKRLYNISKNVLLAGLIILLYFFAYSLSTKTIPDERLYATEALLLYRHNSFPSLYPLLPILTAGALFLFGVVKFSFWIVPLTSTLLTIIVTLLLSLKIFDEKERAILTALLVAFNPFIIWLSAKNMTETVFSLFLILVMWCFSREEISTKQSFSAGLFSFLAYLTRYSGILLFPFVTIMLLIRKMEKRVVCGYLSSLFLLVSFWMLNKVYLGTYFPTETYSFTFINPILTLRFSIVQSILLKIIVGLGLLLGYSAPFFIRPLLNVFSKKQDTFSNNSKRFILPFLIFYSFIHTGYFILLSLGSGYVWSSDHFARYLIPIFPLVALFAQLPFEKKHLNLLVLMLSFILGASCGLYLIGYSDLHSLEPVTWGEFLKKLSEL